jgi:hypothetical protein
MKQAKRVTDRSLYVVSALVAISWVAASLLLQALDAATGVRILIGLVPVIFLVLQIVMAFRYAFGQDELQKRIILEGLAFAFSIALPVIFVVGFLIRAGVHIPVGFMDAGYFMEIALLIGYAVAYRRYR